MKEWFVKLFTDETFFERALRSCVAILGGGLQFVQLPTHPTMESVLRGVGVAAVGGALMIGAGEKNPPVVPPPQ
jgi:hypothetical protein